uniref:Uncharacterized protein n=1 Tax=Aegilops tauschii subsp. strangulata TaxID=200361 RepID=A0A453SNK7_AEGTS
MGQPSMLFTPPPPQQINVMADASCNTNDPHDESPPLYQLRSGRAPAAPTVEHLLCGRGTAARCCHTPDSSHTDRAPSPDRALAGPRSSPQHPLHGRRRQLHCDFRRLQEAPPTAAALLAPPPWPEEAARTQTSRHSLCVVASRPAPPLPWPLTPPSSGSSASLHAAPPRPSSRRPPPHSTAAVRRPMKPSFARRERHRAHSPPRRLRRPGGRHHRQDRRRQRPGGSGVGGSLVRVKKVIYHPMMLLVSHILWYWMMNKVIYHPKKELKKKGNGECEATRLDHTESSEAEWLSRAETRPGTALADERAAPSCRTGMAGQAPAVVAFALAAAILSTPPPQSDNFSNIPPTLSGDDKAQVRIKHPKSAKALQCTSKCVATCIRGGEGPINVRRPLVVFKEGQFRSRLYW